MTATQKHKAQASPQAQIQSSPSQCILDLSTLFCAGPKAKGEEDDDGDDNHSESTGNALGAFRERVHFLNSQDNGESWP